MKIVVFSDTHLRHTFDERKYNFLVKIITDADQVIINGDFWDGYITTFDAFIHSEWQRLFPLLKSKHTVYIFGNHDKQKYSDKRTELFSDKHLHRYTLEWNGKTLLFEHGNRLYSVIDESIPFRFVNKILTYIAHSHFFRVLLEGFELDKNETAKMLAKIKKESKKDTIYILGHTHFAVDDRVNHYINSGCIQHGTATYIVINDKTIELKQENY